MKEEATIAGVGEWRSTSQTFLGTVRVDLSIVIFDNRVDSPCRSCNTGA